MDSCSECRRFTETVTDYCTGDTICTECGLVLDHHFINENAEWRTFENDDNNDHDPNRVGSRTNPLLKSSGLTTVITVPQDKTCSVSKNDLYDLCRAQNNVKNKEDDLLKKAFREIKIITEALALGKGIEFRACEIITKVDSKSLRKEKTLTSFCGASIFTACRELNLSRSLKEISTVLSGVKLKHLRRESEEIKKLLLAQVNDAAPAPAPAPQVIIHTTELVPRFCSKLGIKPREARAIREAVKEAEKYDIRRNPKSVLAAVIYIICQLSDQTKTNSVGFAEVAMAAEVVESTLKGSVKDTSPYALKIIPEWYASKAEITTRLRAIA